MSNAVLIEPAPAASSAAVGVSVFDHPMKLVWSVGTGIGAPLLGTGKAPLRSSSVLAGDYRASARVRTRAARPPLRTSARSVPSGADSARWFSGRPARPLFPERTVERPHLRPGGRRSSTRPVAPWLRRVSLSAPWRGPPSPQSSSGRGSPTARAIAYSVACVWAAFPHGIGLTPAPAARAGASRSRPPVLLDVEGFVPDLYAGAFVRCARNYRLASNKTASLIVRTITPGLPASGVKVSAPGTTSTGGTENPGDNPYIAAPPWMPARRSFEPS